MSDCVSCGARDVVTTTLAVGEPQCRTCVDENGHDHDDLGEDEWCELCAFIDPTPAYAPWSVTE